MSLNYGPQSYKYVSQILPIPDDNRYNKLKLIYIYI